MRGRRRRFGVSVPEELARMLDELARVVNRDRSSLVAEALRVYLHDHQHLLRPHRCAGVIIAWSRSGDVKAEVLEEYMDIVRGHLHAHLDGYCVNVVLVEGDSERIASLTRRLSSGGRCTARYIPLSPSTPAPGERDARREPSRGSQG